MTVARQPVTGEPDRPELLRAKLFVPRPPPDLVPRPRLDERLAAGQRRKLTLLAAPAGFGKTSALTAWCAGSRAQGVEVAWVSLDAGDNDPVRFWSYVAAALDAVSPGIVAPALGLLQGPRPPRAEAVVAALTNALAGLDRDVALVLDDYHAIASPAVHDGLGFLLDHLPPRLRLVVAGRADPPLPLARLRAGGELVELRAADLRFAPDEASAFFAAAGVPLARAEAEALAARAEGWAAALRLAALSLRGRADPAAFVRAFAGSHRFLLDYLTEEVLDRQPEELRAFLLRTAVLDRLSGPLCDAVTGWRDGRATLERLERANLFTVPLDDDRAWYRYHHLFADVLRARLLAAEPALVPDLHRRAAAWFEEAGALPDAVAHALAAGDSGWVAKLVERAAEPMWRRGELATLLGWLEALPSAAVAARPRLAVAHAGAHFLARSYDAEAVGALLDRADAALRSAPLGGERAEQEAVLAAVRAAAASTAEDAERAVGFARAALAGLPAGETFWRVAAELSLGLGLEVAGDTTEAERSLADARRLARASANRYLEVVATMNLARVRAAQGRLGAAADLCREGLLLAAEHAGDALPVTGYLHVQLGKVAYERDDLAAAERHLADGIARVGAVDEQLRVLVEGYAALARLRHARGDAAGAAEAMRRCEEAAAASQLPWAAPLAAAHNARLDLARGDVSAAGRWAAAAGLGLDDDPAYAREAAHLTLARVLIARGEAASALRLLGRLRSAAEATGRDGSVIETLLVEALARRAAGNPGSALPAIAQALAMGEPEGYARSFLDEGPPLAALLAESVDPTGPALWAPLPPALAAYAGRLLAAFAPARSTTGEPAAEPAAAPPEPLTPREREVLELIAAGFANPEIADRLSIGVGTVKSHVNSLFGKLPAASRTQAVARARALGLLPP